MFEWWFEILLIFILLLLGGYISTLKFTLLGARKSEIETAVKTGEKNADLTLALLEKTDSIAISTQVAITFITVISTVLAVIYICPKLSDLLSKAAPRSGNPSCFWLSIIIVVMIIAFLRILIIDAIPRRIAERASYRLALKASGPIRMILTMGHFPVAMLEIVSSGIFKVLGLKPAPLADGAAEERIIDMIDEGAKTGEFDITEQELIKSVFHFSEANASHCMTPRTEISAINIDDKIEKILQFIREEGYSRYPVYRGDLDHIIGMIFTRDIINILYDRDLIIIHDIVRPAYFVPDSKKISEILKDFQANQTHMAIVLDEFGGTAGLVTIEDIIEELVGEIQDEFDEEEKEFVFLGEDTAEVDAMMDVDDFNETFETDLPEEEADTIGGLIFAQIGELPKRRQKITINGVEFTIASLDGNRIESVIARKIHKPPENPQKTE